jgi:hypothetical protein
VFEWVFEFAESEDRLPAKPVSSTFALTPTLKVYSGEYHRELSIQIEGTQEVTVAIAVAAKGKSV